MLGLIAGSYLFAEVSEFSKNTLETWGAKGKILLHTLLRINKGPSVAIFASLIFAALLVLAKLKL